MSTEALPSADALHAAGIAHLHQVVRCEKDVLVLGLVGFIAERLDGANQAHGRRQAGHPSDLVGDAEDMDAQNLQRSQASTVAAGLRRSTESHLKGVQETVMHIRPRSAGAR